MELQEFKANPGKSVFIRIPGPGEHAPSGPQACPGKERGK